MIAEPTTSQLSPRRHHGGWLLLGTLLLAASVGVAIAQPADAQPARPASPASIGAQAAGVASGPARQPSCAAVKAGQLACLSRFRAITGRAAGSTAPPPGLSPADIASAYSLATAPAPKTVVGIVDAQDDPRAEADLAVYRKQFGLPACTSANGCFRKVNQRGVASHYPAGDQGWGEEISLDLDAVSAACPTCHILLVEADSPFTNDLGAAEDTAVRLGAAVVSNSYGTDEYTGMAADAVHWHHPGTAIVASTGDFGFTTAQFPAVLTSTIAVGGTTLTKAPTTARGWTEQAWADAGSGCSAYIAKPAWQHDTHCLLRTVGDVSADADPNTGLAVYDSYLPTGFGGYLIGGGTSQSAPLVAAMIARSGRYLSNASRIYAHPGSLNDAVGGSNGFCGGDYLCTGKRGYDAPTGMGTPRGVFAL